MMTGTSLEKQVFKYLFTNIINQHRPVSTEDKDVDALVSCFLKADKDSQIELMTDLVNMSQQSEEYLLSEETRKELIEFNGRERVKLKNKLQFLAVVCALICTVILVFNTSTDLALEIDRMSLSSIELEEFNVFDLIDKFLGNNKDN